VVVSPNDPGYYPYYYVVPAYPSSYVRTNDAPPPSTAAGYSSEPARAPEAPAGTIRSAAYTPTSPSHIGVAAAGTASNYRSTGATMHQLPPTRPEVQNVIRALRAMPPAARQRQIDSGRYSNLSSQELELVKYAAGLPSSWGQSTGAVSLQAN
jgi:hypothetical protein